MVMCVYVYIYIYTHIFVCLSLSLFMHSFLRRCHPISGPAEAWARGALADNTTNNTTNNTSIVRLLRTTFY